VDHDRAHFPVRNLALLRRGAGHRRVKSTAAPRSLKKQEVDFFDAITLLLRGLLALVCTCRHEVSAHDAPTGATAQPTAAQRGLGNAGRAEK